MKTKILILAATFALTGVGVALADDDECEARVGEWQPRSAVVKMAEARGWTVQRIKTDDGCYEILCTDENGRRFEAIVDPATLQVLATEFGRDDDDRGSDGRRGSHADDDDDDDDDHHGGPAVPRNRPADPDAPLPDNGLFKGKVRPKVQVQ
ncbi:PepSY domain-containing protein [Chthonobacter albigriseus]|uniref:PepSY domain-containing protein n=1 Tax=Chthonobacter albigriseus TaxID=1683161 RepID=UPI0015EF22FA|nr:PepSY domain-containing protein [Chthonobacter albigriseus]